MNVSISPARIKSILSVNGDTPLAD